MDRHRAFGFGGSRRWWWTVRIGRCRRVARRCRRILPNRCRRPRLVGKCQRGACTERTHLQGKIGAAYPRALDRIDLGDRRALLDGARLEAFDLGVVPPRLARLEPAAAAAEERGED